MQFSLQDRLLITFSNSKLARFVPSSAVISLPLYEILISVSVPVELEKPAIGLNRLMLIICGLFSLILKLWIGVVLLEFKWIVKWLFGLANTFEGIGLEIGLFSNSSMFLGFRVVAFK